MWLGILHIFNFCLEWHHRLFDIENLKRWHLEIQPPSFYHSTCLSIISFLPITLIIFPLLFVPRKFFISLSQLFTQWIKNSCLQRIWNDAFSEVHTSSLFPHVYVCVLTCTCMCVCKCVHVCVCGRKISNYGTRDQIQISHLVHLCFYNIRLWNGALFCKPAVTVLTVHTKPWQLALSIYYFANLT